MADPVVRLTIPATSRYLRLARLTAAGIATDLGFDLEMIEDLRIAVDEACALLISNDGDGSAELALAYRAEGDTLVIEGRSPHGGSDPVEIHPVARELLALTADEYDVQAEPDGRSFRLLKRRRPASG